MRTSTAITLVTTLVLLALVPACSRDDARPAPDPAGTTSTTAPDPCRDRPRAATGTTSLAIVDTPAPPGPASASGTITDGTCGTPLAGMKVLLIDELNPAKLVGATTTRADGTWSFPSIAPARYRIELFDPTSTYVTTFLHDAPDFDEADTIDLTATPAFTADEVLHTPAEVPVPDYRGEATGPRIVVIGDSLVQQATGTLREKLEPIGPTSVRGVSFQRTDQMQPVARRFAKADPQVVIIALGNNDLLEQRSTAETVGHLVEMVDLFPRSRCVGIVTVNSRTGQDDFNARANQLNLELLRLSVERPQIKLIDWDAAVRVLLSQNVSPSAWFSDTLHLTPLGAGAFATTMEGTVRSCA